MEAKKDAIFRRLTKLEEEIKKAREQKDPGKLYVLETEHHILSTFFDALERAIQESPNNTELKLTLSRDLLNKLPHNVKMSILCLTEDVCEIKEK